MKILFYGESPCLETGAARVDRHLLDVIVEMGHEVVVLGTSHFWEDEYDHQRYPFKIIPVNGENAIATHQEAGKMITEREGTFDILFISADMHVPNILMEQVKKYTSIVLGAIDGMVKHPDQVAALEYADYPVVYSRYSYEQVLPHLPTIKDKFRCIQLGCEPDVFYPISPEERRAYRAKAFGIDSDERFLVMWANRNQMRKDPARAMKAFHLFHEDVPNSLLYMHARMQDVGGNLVSQALLSGCHIRGDNPEIIFAPTEYTEIAGFDRDKLNRMYNAADVCISTAQGEGWGLTTTEAMSAGTPFIGPANTTFFELLGEDRGYLADCGGDDLWSIYYGVDDSPRPITSCTSLASLLYRVYHHREEAKAKAARARAWAEVHTWKQFKEQWRELLCLVQSSPALQDKMVAI
jgi:glycosyltransferase involved in cell wall biosynthesis